MVIYKVELKAFGLYGLVYRAEDLVTGASENKSEKNEKHSQNANGRTADDDQLFAVRPFNCSRTACRSCRSRRGLLILDLPGLIVAIKGCTAHPAEN
jgi:hypothetical protein